MPAGVPGDERWQIALAVIALGAMFWFVRKRFVLEDSAQFRQALRIWQPVITSVHRSPRSAKRLVNRARYLAMRSRYTDAAFALRDRLATLERIARMYWSGSARNMREHLSGNPETSRNGPVLRPPWDRRSRRRSLLGKLKSLGAARRGASRSRIREHVLVAMAAIHHCDPKFMSEAAWAPGREEAIVPSKENREYHLVTLITLSGEENDLQNPMFKMLKSSLSECLVRHYDSFGADSWPPTEAELRLFRSWVEEAEF